MDIQIMKSLPLGAAEVRTVLDTGKLVRFVVMEPPWRIRSLCDFRWLQGKPNPEVYGAGGVWAEFFCPFSPGERAWTNPPNASRAYCVVNPFGERLTLSLSSVSPVRIQDVSEEDAKATGITDEYDDWHEEMANIAPAESTIESRREWFRRQWDASHPKPCDKWEENPWCWKEVWKKVEDEQL